LILLQSLNIVKAIFHSFFVHLNTVFIYDHLPGEHVFEIRYMNITPDNLSEITNYKFGQAPRVELGEHVIQLSFRFNNGKISSIRVPRRVIESIDNFVQGN
jgi:hypothetical protein